jgi:protein SCO1/2
MNEKAMIQQSTPWKTTVFIIAGLMAMVLGVLVWLNLPANRPAAETAKPSTKEATILPEFRTLPSFSLLDQSGKAFDNQSLLGHWTFMSFGYTYCPDICPTTMAQLSDMKQRLQAHQALADFQVAFVSIDPQRDTQQRLAEYVNYFDPSFLGVTGNDAALQKLTRPLGILYAKVKTEDSAMGYVMDHSASIVLIDPQGRYHALFSPPHDAGNMAEDFMAIAVND